MAYPFGETVEQEPDDSFLYLAASLGEEKGNTAYELLNAAFGAVGLQGIIEDASSASHPRAYIHQQVERVRENPAAFGLHNDPRLGEGLIRPANRDYVDNVAARLSAGDEHFTAEGDYLAHPDGMKPLDFSQPASPYGFPEFIDED